MEVRRVAVLGAGTMGRGIVRVLAAAGCSVSVFDPAPNVLAAFRETLPSTGESSGHVDFEGDISEAARGADLVLETVPEDLEVKVAALQEAAAVAPAGVPIGSNTSSLDLEVLGSRSGTTSQLIGVHWFNPPEVIPGVEVAYTQATDQQVIEWTMSFLQGIGKQPVLVRNSPGFVANRLHEALLAEALRCVAEEVATPEEIDRIVRLTFGPRFAVCGPFEVIDQTGLEVQQRAFENLHRQLESDAFAPSRFLDQLMAAGRTGLSVGRGVYEYQEPFDVVMARRHERIQAVFTAASNQPQG